MGNCSKIPRTNSAEEIKQDHVNRRPDPNALQSRPNPALPPLLQPSLPNHQPSPVYYPPLINPLSRNPIPSSNNQRPPPPPPQGQSYYTQSVPISQSGRHPPSNPIISETKSVSRYCRIIDEKLELAPTNDHLHFVNFVYKCRFPARATIYYFVREGFDRRDSRHYFYANPDTFPKAITFDLPPGNAEIFENKYKAGFSNVNKQLLEVADKCTYPLVIEIECTNPVNLKDSQVLINCYKITHEESGFHAMVLKQMIKIEGNYKVLSNFYGTSADADESECLICLSAEKTVAVLPCRHVCYCEQCIGDIQKQSKSECPVCRTAVTSFLKVHH